MKAHRGNGSSGTRTLVFVIALVVAVLYLAREILIPLAFAVTLALVLSPAVVGLGKIHIGRAPASLLVVTLLLVGVTGMSVVIFNQLVQVINELPNYRDNIDSKIEAMRAPAKGALGRATQNVRELGKELSETQTPVPPPGQRQRGSRRNAASTSSNPMPVEIVAEPVSELQYVRDLIRPFLEPIGVLGIVLIFTIFLLVEQNDLRNRLFRLAGLNRLSLMTEAVDDATRRVSRYLMLQFLVNACFGTILGLALYFIGVPFAALWGAVAAIFRIIPYIGSATAGLLPLILSLAVFDGWMRPFSVLLVFAVLEIVTANLIEPWLYGTHTGISSLALLLTAVFWTTLWGPAGLILSTPLTVCLVVLGRHVPQLSFLHILLGDEPVLACEAQLYQRLLVMDGDGARLIVDKHLSDNSLLQLYDSVIVPTLIMAERDRQTGELDPDREEFVFMGIREILSELAERQSPSPDSREVETSRGRILCIPANNESDEITAAMLAQLLLPEGRIALSFPNDASVENGVQVVEPTGDDLFCISAVPPLAFARARTLDSHLRRKFPKTRIVVAIWGFSGDTNRALKRFQPSRPDGIVTSMASALEWASGKDGSDEKTTKEDTVPITCVEDSEASAVTADAGHEPI